MNTENQELIKTFTEQHIENIKRLVNSTAGLIPMFYILAKRIDGSIGIIVVPVIPAIIDMPRKFLIEFLKMVKSSIKEDGTEIICVSWASEGWAYNPPKDWTPESNVDYHQFPRNEVISIIFSSESKNENYTYKMIRPDGIAVNVLGEIVDQIELEEVHGGEISNAVGTLSNLYNV